MTSAPAVTVVPAFERDAALLANLLELYVHDMSEFFLFEVGEDGRFGYPRLSLYWSEPDQRHAFLIRAGEKLAGFALVTHGSPASDDPDVLDLAEFFVLRRYRRSQVGRQAALALWKRLPAAWTVRCSEANRAGLPFWNEVVRAYTGGAFTAETRPGTPNPWRVFSFRS